MAQTQSRSDRQVAAPRRRRWWLVALVAVPLAILLAVLIGDVIAEQAVEAELARIRAAGEPATLAELLERMPPDVERDSAAKRMLEHAAVINADERRLWRETYVPQFGRHSVRRIGSCLSAWESAAAADFVATYGAAVAGIVAALEGPEECLPWYDAGPLGPGEDMRYDALLRTVSRVLVLVARLRVEEGDSSAAVRIVQQQARLDAVLACQPRALTHISRVNLRSMLCVSIEDLLNLTELPDAELRALEAAIRAWPDTDLRATLVAERVLTRAALDDSAAGRTTDGWAWERFTPILWRRIDLQFLHLWRRIIDSVGPPDRVTIANLEATQAYVERQRGVGAVPLSILMPSQVSMARNWVRDAALRRALVALIACDRYRVAHGRWPESLEALVPAYLDAVPDDPFGDGPLGYGPLAGGGVMVWSVGADGVDDGGDLRKLEPDAGVRRQAADIGFVLLDPERRGTAAETEGEGDGQE